VTPPDLFFELIHPLLEIAKSDAIGFAVDSDTGFGIARSAVTFDCIALALLGFR
jgi:hypothetical protein